MGKNLYTPEQQLIFAQVGNNRQAKHNSETRENLFDLAVNKLSTINQRTQIKDFVDLYYLFEQYTLWDLIEGVRVKFRQEIDPWLLSGDLSVVQEFTEMPRMIKPLTLSKFKQFYWDLAKKLARTAVE